MTEHISPFASPDLSVYAIDRDLPVALGAQLRGIIEFGIGLGTFRPGDRLPSVRDLAEHLRVAPMTVAAVYAELGRAGMLVSRKRAGTFVADVAPSIHAPARSVALHRAIDALILQARALGLRPSDLIGLIAARVDGSDRARGRPRVVVVGHFAQTTSAYCAAMSETVGDGVSIEPTTLRAITEDEAARTRASLADLVITFAHRRHDVIELLPEAAVAAVTFIPSAGTRQALAALDPGCRLVLVSIFPEFTPVMKAGVQRFAPHVSDIAVVMHDAPTRDEVLGRAEMIVYATGADEVGPKLPTGVPAFEYRHTPDPGDVRRLILPLLEREPETALRRRIS